jgi:predicted metal-dependent hydrolase
MSADKGGGRRLEFKYGQSVVPYTLLYQERKNLAITVRPDKSVTVKAPSESSVAEVKEKLQKRGKWVLKQINYFDKFHPIQPPRMYVSGETHCYLGRRYRLRVRRGRENVRLSGQFFMVTTKNPKDRDRVRLLMLDWYATHAKAYLDQRVGKYATEILDGRSKGIDIKYGIMKTRWGTCKGDRSLKLNIELIKAPVPCVDYVVAHELCHLVHSNHDRQFYRMLDSVIPDWQERKALLEKFISQ